MLTNRFIACILMGFIFINLLAQSEWIEWGEEVSDERDFTYWQEQYEALSEWAAHPLNINTITKKQLEQFPFLSDKLIENILYYLYKYGPMLTENELMGIEGMDYQTRSFLQKFIYIGNAENKEDNFSWKQLFKYNKQELLTRLDLPLNVKAGYAAYSNDVLRENPNKVYLGNSIYHNFRYRFTFKDKLSLGFTAEKDSGEPFFKGHNKKGYDFYSAYLFLKDVGRFQSLALGNYQVNFGYGLIINTGFGFGKASSLLNIHKVGKGISKYTSVGESNYLQGIAATYRLNRRWNSSIWYSFRNLDGNVDNMFIKSLKTDGYHRLKKDVEKKNTLYNHLIGCNLTYNGKMHEYGLTAVYNSFNKVLNPDFRSYNRYYPRGKSFYNIGGYYKLYIKNFIFSGELGVDKKGSLACLNSISYSPSVNKRILLINRYYDKRYQALYANCFSENSKIQNELGSYIGLEMNVLKNMKLLCYGDVFYFPYKKYQVDKSKTIGFESGFQLSYSQNNSLFTSVKYSIKNKAKNYKLADDEKVVLPCIRQRFNYQIRYDFTKNISLKGVVDYVRSSYWKQSASNGIAVGNTLKWIWGSLPVQTQICGIGFYTKDYNSRIYMYEPGLLYSFSMYSFYGKGMRWSANIRCLLKDRFTFQVKWGWTHYADRNKIGTGLEEIQGSNKYDLQFQLKLKW